MPCPLCKTPLDITKPEYKLRDETADIVIYKCPNCSQLVLDDFYGWKGSGVVAHVNEEEIADYVKTGRLKRGSKI